MKKQNHLTRIVDSKGYPLLLFIVSFLFVTLFSRSTSFLYAFEGADPSIFKQMGRAVLQGKTMYIDYFDNKGCLLYFLHALGIWLGGNTILLLMQSIALTITLLIWTQMLTLYRDQRSCFICLGIALFLLICFYGAGDQTQEWCLPLISYPLLVYFQAYKTKTEIRHFQMFLIGLCFGVITFIQVNNACAFLGFVAYLWIQWFLKKNFKNLISSVIAFILGWGIIAIFCVLYFYFKAGWHGVYEMIYASFLSNFEYINNSWETRWIHFVPYGLFLLSFMAFQVINSNKEKEIFFPLLISFCLFVVSFGKLCNAYYLMSILPLCIVSMMTNSFFERKRANMILFLAMVLSLMFYVGNTVKDLLLQNKKIIVIYNDFHHCIENIPENERDSIYNYNLYWNGTSMMEHEKLIQCNRVLYTSLLSTLPTLWEEETKKHSELPKWIMLSFNQPYKQEDAYYIQNTYELICSFPYDFQYFQKPTIGDKFDVCLYRRKD